MTGRGRGRPGRRFGVVPPSVCTGFSSLRGRPRFFDADDSNSLGAANFSAMRSSPSHLSRRFQYWSYTFGGSSREVFRLRQQPLRASIAFS